MTWTEPRMERIDVEGGALSVGIWGGGSRTVLASHGITANHRCFGEVAAQLAERGEDVRLVAVDHRGRGGSAQTPGPYGLLQHARDLLDVLDALGEERAVLVGHSMGAFIAANAAVLAPDRVDGLVLIDGALPIQVELPEGASVEEVVRAVIGPALDRLERTVPDPEAYVEMWRAHPAVGGRYFTDVAEAYVRYDLVESEDGGWRSPVDRDAVLIDGEDAIVDERARAAVERTSVPSILLWAPRGLLDAQPGLYAGQDVAAVDARLDHLETRLVEDVNHYSIVFSPEGARAVAGAIVDHLD